MTKVADRLVEQQLVERVSDPLDRRTVRLQLTEHALSYIDHFLEQDGGYFKSVLGQIGQDDLARFQAAIKTIIDVLGKIPNNECYIKVDED